MALIVLYEIKRFLIRNHFISNIVLDNLKFKKLLELHIFYKKLLYKQPSTRQPKFKKLLELHGKRYETSEK